MASKITVTQIVAKKTRGRPRKNYCEDLENEENISTDKTHVIRFLYN